MFGNHPLPNIAPSLLCLSPPPPHIPLPPPSPLPLANARMGQARARAPPLVEGCGQTTRHVTTRIPRRVARWALTTMSPLEEPAYTTSQLPTTHAHHITTGRTRVHHVTAANDTRLPRHRWKDPPTLSGLFFVWSEVQFKSQNNS